MIFVGDAAGPGTVTEVHRISGDSIWGSPGNNVVASRSPDGDLFGFGVTRSITCGGGCTERYAIEVYDRSSGVNRIVADGVAPKGPWGLVFSPDGSRLLYETDGNLYLVELGSGTPD